MARAAARNSAWSSTMRTVAGTARIVAERDFGGIGVGPGPAGSARPALAAEVLARVRFGDSREELVPEHLLHVLLPRSLVELRVLDDVEVRAEEDAARDVRIGEKLLQP